MNIPKDFTHRLNMPALLQSPLTPCFSAFQTELDRETRYDFLQLLLQ